MKKLLIMLLFFVGTAVTSAQVDMVDDTQEQYLDQLEQFQETPTQLDLERRTQLEADRIEAEKEAKKREKKLAKEKRKQEARRKSERNAK